VPFGVSTRFRAVVADRVGSREVACGGAPHAADQRVDLGIRAAITRPTGVEPSPTAAVSEYGRTRSGLPLARGRHRRAPGSLRSPRRTTAIACGVEKSSSIVAEERDHRRLGCDRRVDARRRAERSASVEPFHGRRRG
jgi:hypothetical protein